MKIHGIAMIVFACAIKAGEITDNKLVLNSTPDTNASFLYYLVKSRSEKFTHYFQKHFNCLSEEQISSWLNLAKIKFVERSIEMARNKNNALGYALQVGLLTLVTSSSIYFDMHCLDLYYNQATPYSYEPASTTLNHTMLCTHEREFNMFAQTFFSKSLLLNLGLIGYTAYLMGRFTGKRIPNEKFKEAQDIVRLLEQSQKQEKDL